MTDTSRSGLEQLLVSSAIDASLDKVAFDSLAGAAVFVDERYLECTDKKYVVGSVRQRVFQAGCRLVETAGEADAILELSSGAVGTDRAEGYIGTPTVSLPGPLPVQLPEIKLLSQTSQYGTAKIGLIAYDAKTRQALSSGALSRARSENSRWTILGLVPYSSGSIHDEIAMTRSRRATEPRALLSHRGPHTPSGGITIPASDGYRSSAGPHHGPPPSLFPPRFRGPRGSAHGNPNPYANSRTTTQ